MRPPISRGSLFVVACISIAGIAASPNDSGALDGDASASPGDSGASTDATMAANGAAEAAVPDSAVNPFESGPSGWPGPTEADGAPPPFSGPNIFQQLCMDDPKAPAFAFTSVPAPYTDAAGCKLFDSQGHATLHNCQCDSCFDLIQQCDALKSCREIHKCRMDSGCTDSNSCYLLPGSPCTTVINQWGSGGVATALVTMLGTCGTTNKCPNQ
jgi:hypothetical protein